MATKQELMETIKNEIPWYAQPRGMNSRSKADLEDFLNEARRLGLKTKSHTGVQK